MSGAVQGTLTVEEIQKFIENMPCEYDEDEIESLKLEDLVEDLKSWSKDEEWRNLVASIATN